MTLDEAVAEIGRVGQCVVLVDAERGEILEVCPGIEGPRRDHRVACVDAPWIEGGRRIAVDAVTGAT